MSTAPMQPSELVTQFESAVNGCTRYHTEYMGKAMPDREYERFVRLRDETIPRLRAALNAALAAPTQAPMQPSYEQIDELLQDHAKGSREMHDFARSVLALAAPTQAAEGNAIALLREVLSGMHVPSRSDLDTRIKACLAAAPAAAVEPRTTPLCRDCADFGPICPSSGQPCDKRAAAAPEGLTVNSKQAESIARQYCGGLDTRWSFSDFGLRLMLQQYADWASRRRPATPAAGSKKYVPPQEE